jgi:gliding motility-associated-like protein
MWYENSCGGTSIGSGTTISVTPNNSTSYFVRAEGGTCGNTVCADISINVLDADAYMVAFDNACGIGQPFTLNNGIPLGGTYSGTGVSGGMFDPAVAGVGVHTVTYSYTETNGCTANATADIEITESTIEASAIPVIESCTEGGVTIVVSATGGSGFYNYEWSNGATGNPLTYVEPGTYAVTVFDSENCATTVSDIVIDESQSCIQVANTFTPNGDGTNDTWNLDFNAYNNAKVQVYSKWGTLVYETDGLMIQWDGRSNDGADLPAGTYYYIIDLNGGEKTQNGPISIVR